MLHQPFWAVHNYSFMRLQSNAHINLHVHWGDLILFKSQRMASSGTEIAHFTCNSRHSLYMLWSFAMCIRVIGSLPALLPLCYSKKNMWLGPGRPRFIAVHEHEAHWVTWGQSLCQGVVASGRECDRRMAGNKRAVSWGMALWAFAWAWNHSDFHCI